MIDPLLPPRSAERLAALRPAPPKRRKPAHTSKIMTAGISTTALLGLVTAMGWPTGTSNAQNTAQTVPGTGAITPTAVQVAPVAAVAVALPAATAATVPVVVDTTVPAAPATVQALVPATVPTTVAPPRVVVPVAVPAAQPVKKKKRVVVVSNTTTRTSGS